MRTVPETQHQVRQQVNRVWEAPDRESLVAALRGLANALEAHVAEEESHGSLLSSTERRAPHQADAVDHTRKRLKDLWRRAVHLRHDFERDGRSFHDCQRSALTLAAGVNAMARAESSLIARSWYEELGVGD